MLSKIKQKILKPKPWVEDDDDQPFVYKSKTVYDVERHEIADKCMDAPNSDNKDVGLVENFTKNSTQKITSEIRYPHYKQREIPKVSQPVYVTEINQKKAGAE